MANVIFVYSSSPNSARRGSLPAIARERPTGHSRISSGCAGFRRGLLRHISIEEWVLFAELRMRDGESALSRQLHRDHAALCALLVPPPGPVEIAQIAEILRVHNDLEERPGGLYELVESLVASELDALLARVHAIPEVKVAPHTDSPLVRKNIAALLQDAEKGRSQLLQELPR